MATKTKTTTSATMFCSKCGAVQVKLERGQDVYIALNKHVQQPGGHRIAFVVVAE